MRRSLTALAGLVLCLGSLAACGDDTATAPAADPPAEAPSCDFVGGGQPAKEVSPPPAQATQTGPVEVAIATTQGDITATLDGAAAPCTVTSFVSLAEQDYFDDTPCHRLTTADAGIFVLQCGDPLGQGIGGPGYTIPDELDGTETYPAGTMAMANTGQPNSGGSQFFLVYDETPLPPSYTVFGQLSADGLAVVQKVAAGGTQTPADGAPNLEVTISDVSVG